MMTIDITNLREIGQLENLKEQGFIIEKLIALKARASQNMLAQENRRFAFVKWLIVEKGKFNEFELSVETADATS